MCLKICQFKLRRQLVLLRHLIVKSGHIFREVSSFIRYFSENGDDLFNWGEHETGVFVTSFFDYKKQGLTVDIGIVIQSVIVIHVNHDYSLDSDGLFRLVLLIQEIEILTW